MYNTYNFEANYRQYLQTKGASKSTIKNYLSDYRHFWGWFVMTLKQQDTEHDPKILSRLTPELLEQYKRFLVVNAIPATTINRRLATVRSFCKYCILQRWIEINPAISLKSVEIEKSTDLDLNIEQKTSERAISDIIRDFTDHLNKSAVTPTTARNYIGDAKQFLTWLNQA